MKNETLLELEQLFLALSDKTRLALLGLMSGGPVSVGFLADSLGLSQPKISRHLAYLRSSGLVSTRRDGKWIYYGIEMPLGTAARHLLTETLASLDPASNSPGMSEHDRGEPGSNGHRNEMEIHLL
jgi:ArsR family transcriptional regulator, arsenate/arsenite/antimonite-responsive transcriptional repressor